MSSFQYAGQEEVAYNPASEDLNMNLNAITNCAAFQTFTVDTGVVNVATNLTFKDGSFNTSFTALGLNENQSYNLPSNGGTSGQVLGLDGNSGQMRWFDVCGSLVGITSLNNCIGATTVQSNNLSVTTDVLTSTITIDYNTVPGGVADVNGCAGSVTLQSMTLNITPDTGTGQIALDVTNALPAGAADGDYPVWDTGTSTYVATAAPVTSLNGITGAAALTNTDGTITGDVSGQVIDFRVTVPVPAGATDGDYAAWDTGTSAYVATAAPVTSLSSLTGAVVFDSASSTISFGGSGQTIDLSVTVPVPAGANAGDYPAWDTGTSAYVATAAPSGGVPNVNGITGAVSIESISLNLVTDTGAGTISIDLPPVVMDFLGQTGSITAESSNHSILVQAGTGGATDFTLSYPCGLASPGALDVGSPFFTITNISIYLTGSSVIQATLQNPDDLANPGTCWLMYAYPIADVSGDGGGITFMLSDAITAGSTLLVSWAVAKF